MSFGWAMIVGSGFKVSHLPSMRFGNILLENNYGYEGCRNFIHSLTFKWIFSVGVIQLIKEGPNFIASEM
jgi:hypothetical protein